jgi:O-antigen/teichoic acid export membrane protein
VRHSFKYAVIFRIIASACTVVTAFLSVRVYNLYVSKEIYGVILVGLQFIGYLPLVSSGFRTVIGRQMLAEADPAKKAQLGRFGQMLLSYFLVFATFASMAIMAAYSQEPGARATGLPVSLFIASGAAAVTSFLSGSQLGLLVSAGEQVQSSIIQGLSGLLGVSILWGSFAAGTGVWAFPISTVVTALAIVAACRFAMTSTAYDVPLFVWSCGPGSWARLVAIWRQALDALLNQIAMILVFTVDLVIVGIAVGPGAAAIYGVITRAVTISRQMLSSLAEAAWPRLAGELDDTRRAGIMRKVDRLNAWVVGAWYGAMAATLHPFLSWLVKPDWVGPQPLILLMILRSLLISLTSPHAYGLMSAGRFRELATINMQEGLLGLTAGIALSLTYGYYGVAYAFLGATIAVQSWRMTREYFRFAHDTHWITEWFACTGRGTLAAVVAVLVAAAVVQLSHVLPVPRGMLAVVGGGIGLAVPTLIVVALWRLTGKVP